MSGFSTDWLSMREPYDHAARSTSLVRALVARLPKDGALDLLELAVGFGSGPRFVSPMIPNAQRWVLLDHDAELLRGLEANLPDGPLASHEVETLQFDLRHLDSLRVPADAVFTQALLDLVSHDWLVSLADWLAERAVPFLGALSVDGRVSWNPEHPLDAPVLRAFQAHQLGDRGFGASPGIRAAPVLAKLLSDRGFKVSLERTDWEVPSTDTGMLTQMAEGIAQAAGEAFVEGGTSLDDVSVWLTDRLAAIEQGQVRLSVGHLDLLAIPGRVAL
jgi:hypothetical protein